MFSVIQVRSSSFRRCRELQAYVGKRISSQARRELLQALRLRYRGVSKADKARILDEFTAVTGYHRKYGIRLLSQPCDTAAKAVHDGPVRSRRIYDEAVKEALTVLWEASDRICGKQLKAVLPELLNAMQRYGHLSLDADVERRVLCVSAATID